MFVRMKESDYARLPPLTRQKFLSERVIIPDEHKRLYEEDNVYRELYRTYRTAKKDLEEYKFKKRHK